MKFRASLILIMALACLFALNSCVKKYTCHCNIKYSGAPGLPDSTSQEYDITDTKTGAKSKCANESGTYTNNGITTMENCYLY